MKNIMRTIVTIMVMAMVITGITPMTAEAKSTKTSITVVNKATGKKVGKKLSLTAGKKSQLTVKYGKKTVTKKAKYKPSNKTIVAVSKKGKLTAKKAGTSTVTVTYKKKTKKIKVTVKTNTVKTTEATTENWKDKQKVSVDDVTIEDLISSDVATRVNIKASEEDCKKFQQMIIEHNQNDPNPSCAHEWKAELYQSDIGDIADNFSELYKDHLFLHRIWCKKCHEYAITNSVPYLEAMNYTSDDFAKVILCYRTDLFSDDLITGGHGGIKHKHKMIHGYSPESNGYSWSCECLCKYCKHVVYE